MKLSLENRINLNQYAHIVQRIYQSLDLKLLQKIGFEIQPFEYDFVYSHMPIKAMKRTVNPNRLAQDIYKNIEDSTFYVHIPFCERSCSYCYFYKKTNYTEQEVDEYLKYLRKEFHLLKNFINNFDFIKSIYIGGGTPSILNEKQLAYLFNIFNNDIKPGEVALEMHPETVTDIKIRFLRQVGATRISFGIQTFDDKLLRLMNRGIVQKEILEKINIVSNLFDNWNIDLIYGLPYQTKKHIVKDIEIVKEIMPPSITWYEVWFSPRKHEIKIPINKIPKKYFMNRDDFIKTKIFIDESLKELGYVNFYNDWYVLSERYSTIYEEYKIKSKGNIGVGLGIYEYFNRYTFENASNWNRYYDLIKENKIPIEFYRKMTESDFFIKKTMMGIKTLIPFNLQDAKEHFNKDMFNRLAKLINNNVFFIDENKWIKLNKKYNILRDFIIIYLLGGYGWKIIKIGEFNEKCEK